MKAKSKKAIVNRGEGDGIGLNQDDSQEYIQHRAIEQRAFELYLQRGGEPGRELEDWFEAERQVKDISPRRARMTPMNP